MSVPLVKRNRVRTGLRGIRARVLLYKSRVVMYMRMWWRVAWCHIWWNFWGALLYDAIPHEKLLGILSVSNPATRKDLADRTWGCSGTNPKCKFCSKWYKINKRGAQGSKTCLPARAVFL